MGRGEKPGNGGETKTDCCLTLEEEKKKEGVSCWRRDIFAFCIVFGAVTDGPRENMFGEEGVTSGRNSESKASKVLVVLTLKLCFFQV